LRPERRRANPKESPIRAMPTSLPADNSVAQAPAMPDVSSLPASTADAGAQAPTQTVQQPSAEGALASAVAAPRKPGSIMRGILAGALAGMAGSVGQRTFGGGLAAGVAGGINEQWRQKQFEQEQQLNQSRVRFQDASAAHLT